MRIRKLWACLVVLYLLMAAFGVAAFVASGDFDAMAMLMLAIDLFAVYGLSQYVLYRPIPYLWLRIAYLLIALVLALRFGLALYVLRPLSTNGSVSLWLVVGVVLGIPLVYALLRYATSTQPTHR